MPFLKNDFHSNGMKIYIKMGESKTLFKSLLPYRDLYTDINLIISDETSSKTFKCHRIVLAAGSKYFRSLFQSTMKESRQETIELKDTDPNLFEVILNSFYGAPLEYNFESWREYIAFYTLAQRYEILEIEKDIMYGHDVPDKDFDEYIQILIAVLNRQLDSSAISDIAAKIGPETDLSNIEYKLLRRILEDWRFRPELRVPESKRGPLGATKRTEYWKYHIIKKCKDKRWLPDWYSLDDPYWDPAKPDNIWSKIRYFDLPPECRKEIPDPIRKKFNEGLELQTPELSKDVNSHYGIFQVVEIHDSEEVTYMDMTKSLLVKMTIRDKHGNKRLVKYQHLSYSDGYDNVFVDDIIYIFINSNDEFSSPKKYF